MLKVSYPDAIVGQGFVYRHSVTGGVFQNINIYTLHGIVSKHCAANNLTLNNDEFEDNLCRHTPNIVCTEGVRGIGDLIHMFASPIAGAIDQVLNTNLAGCGGCFKRRNQMNE